MSKHRMTKRILDRRFSVCWGNKQNLHSDHLEELEMKTDEILHFVERNKRQIKPKNFRVFLSEISESFDKLKNSCNVCEVKEQ